MPIAVQTLEAPTVRERVRGGRSPLFRCDACGKEIPKPDVGRVAWDAEENATRLSVAFLHEGCVEAHRRTTEARLRVDRMTNFVASLDRYLP